MSLIMIPHLRPAGLSQLLANVNNMDACALFIGPSCVWYMYTCPVRPSTASMAMAMMIGEDDVLQTAGVPTNS
jgi:hypothetical protein